MAEAGELDESEVAAFAAAIDSAYDRIAGPGETYTSEDLARALMEPSSAFQALGGGAYRVNGVRVSPTTGLYITKDNDRG